MARHLFLLETADDAALLQDLQSDHLSPEIVLISVRDKALLPVVKETIMTAPTAKIIVVTGSLPLSQMIALFSVDAHGLIHELSHLGQLFDAIQTVMRGQGYLDPALAELGIIRPLIRGAALGLTERQRTVLQLVANGLSNQEIARQLHISVDTAKSHVHRILAHLGVKSRILAARIAWEQELVE